MLLLLLCLFSLATNYVWVIPPKKFHSLQLYGFVVMVSVNRNFSQLFVLPSDSVHNSTLHIFNAERPVGWGCILNCLCYHPYLVSTYAFCWSAIPTSCYIFNVFYSCYVTFFSRRCWILPSIYHRAASLSHRLPLHIGWRSIVQTRLSSNTPCTQLYF